MGRFVGSLLLFAVLAIGSYAASTGGSTQSGQLATADLVASETAESQSGYVTTSDFSWH
jgi:hypothetical protein